MLQTEVGKDGGLIDMSGDLFDAALGGDVLGARQLGAPTEAREADEVLGNQWHGPPRALLPRRIGG